MKRWRKFDKPVVHRNKAKLLQSQISFDTKLKQFSTVLLGWINTTALSQLTTKVFSKDFRHFFLFSETTRIVGNKKGILTRQRQPKAAARVLRQRYLNISVEVEENSWREDNAGFMGRFYATENVVGLDDRA